MQTPIHLHVARHKQLLTLCLFFLIYIHSPKALLAQSPGGVNNNLELWLKADPTNSNPNLSGGIWTWTAANDPSKQGTSPNNAPSINSNSINFNPTVELNNAWFDINQDINVNELDVFLVYKKTNSQRQFLFGNSTNILANGGNSKKRYTTNFLVSNGQPRNPDYYNNGNAAGVYLNNLRFDDNTASEVSNIYLNGVEVDYFDDINQPNLINPLQSLIVSNTTVSTPTPNMVLGSFLLDQLAASAPNASPFQAAPESDALEISEAIFYHDNLAGIDREKIASYLAIKYGITLPSNYRLSNNAVVWHRNANGNVNGLYNHNIVGIAQDNGSQLEQPKSKSEANGAVLTVEKHIGTTIGNHQALVIGHNDLSLSSEVGFQASDNYFAKGERLARVWRVQETGGTFPNINLSFDKTALPNNLPANWDSDHLFLLIADDDSFTTNLQVHKLSNNTNSYDIEDISLEGIKYFSIANLETAFWGKVDNGNVPGNVYNNNTMTQLTDVAFGLNNLTAANATAPSSDPTSIDEINFNPAIRFNNGASGRFLEKQNFEGFGRNGSSAFLVLRRDATTSPNTSTDDALFSYAYTGSPNEDNEWLMQQAVNINRIVGGTSNNSPTSNHDINDGFPCIITNRRGSGSADQLFKNAAANGSNSNNYRTGYPIKSGGIFMIGQEQDLPSFDPNQAYKGDFAELIIFNKRVSNQERSAIETYLAIKYGITLSQDYNLADGVTPIWDRSTNTNYNNNIAGVGRNTIMQLDQQKSKSQNDNVPLTIETLTALADESFLLWGSNAGDYNSFSATNAPTGMLLNDRIWHTSNHQNVQGVKLIFDLPTSANQLTMANNFRLVVANNASFTSPTVYTGIASGNTLEFSNPNLADETYFTLALVEEVTLQNNTTAAVNYEACVGDEIMISYNWLSVAPAFVRLADNTNATVTVTINPTPAPTQNSSFSFTVPNNAGTGVVEILDASNNLIYTFGQPLLVHNPTVSFALASSLPLCTEHGPSTLFGTPAGGVFSSTNTTITNAISGNTFNPSTVTTWGPTNIDSLPFDITYTYTPSYTNNTTCPATGVITSTNSYTIYDNRFNQITFPTIAPPFPTTAADNIDLVNGATATNIFNSIQPSLGNPGAYPLTFTGTYVDNNVFKTEDLSSGGLYSITATYNNNGCVGTATNTLEVSSSNNVAPGGVSSHLDLWLDANELPSGGGQSANWPSRHTNNFFANYLTTNTYQVNNNAFNFNKGVRIDDEYFDANVDVNQAQLNVFIVYKEQQNNSMPLWGNSATGTSIKANSRRLDIPGITPVITNLSSNLQQAHLQHLSTSGTNGFVKLDANNFPFTLDPNLFPVTSTSNIHSGVYLGITTTGSNSGVNTDDFDVAEFIVYQRSLSTVEQDQVRSYLGIKYGITLDHDYILAGSSPITIWSSSVNTSFSDEIVGIANDPLSGLNQVKSKSQLPNSHLTISKHDVANDPIPNQAALVVAHNGANTNNSTAFNSVDNFFIQGRHINRIWRCQKTGNFNGFDLEFQDAINLPGGFGNGTLVLLVADDDAFTNNVKAYPVTKGPASQDPYIAENVQMNSGQYFTLGRNLTTLWVKADATDNEITVSNNITKLADQAFGVNDLTADPADAPLFIGVNSLNPINFNPVVRFNHLVPALGKVISNNRVIGFGNIAASTFLVVRRDTSSLNNTTRNEALLSYSVPGTPGTDNEFLIWNPENIGTTVRRSTFTNSPQTGFNITNNDGTPYLFSFIRRYNNNSMSTVHNAYLNATVASNGFNGNTNHNGQSIRSGGSIAFGQEQDFDTNGSIIYSPNQNQDYRGDLAEAIVLNRNVSATDRNVIQSYLAIKYGITLSGDYTFRGINGNNTTIWDASANNANYNNDIVGIGKDDFFQLDQKRSKSQNVGTVLTLAENTNNPLANQAYVICGNNAANYNNFTSNLGGQISDRIWKIEATSATHADFIFDLPTPPSGQGNTNLRLLVDASSSTFSGSSMRYPGTISSNQITFSNVPINGAAFFTIAFLEDINLVNVTTSSVNFEACVGDIISINYGGLSNSSTVNAVELRDQTGMPLILTSNDFLSSSNLSNGTILIEVPANAGPGNIRLLDVNTLPVVEVYNFNQNFVVHNPVIDFFPQTTLLCAVDQIPLNVIPAGGTFMAMNTDTPTITYPNFITQNTNNTPNTYLMEGINLNWHPDTNNLQKKVTLSYTYQPYYSTGAQCPANSAQQINKDFIVYDNRLSQLSLTPKFLNNVPATVADRIFDLDTSITTGSVIPTHPFNWRFAGNGNNHVAFINGTFQFLTEQVPPGAYSIEVSYDNNGCVGRINEDLSVTAPIAIPGLEDTVCIGAEPLIFGRDTNLPYSTDTTSNGNGTLFIVHRNLLRQSDTQDSSQTGTISALNISPGSETFEFDPSSLNLSQTPAPTSVLIRVYYRTITEVRDSITGMTLSLDSSTIVGTRQVTLHYPQQLTLNGVDPYYCYNNPVDLLQTTPAYQYLSVTKMIATSSEQTNTYSSLDTVKRVVGQSGTQFGFDPKYHFDRAIPASAIARDLDVELFFIVNQYGCVDTIQEYTQIKAPTKPLFTPAPSYCSTVGPQTLNGTLTPGSYTPPGSGIFLAAPGLDTTTNQFSPSTVQPGPHIITYQFTDLFSCSSTYSDTLWVTPPAEVEIRVGNVVPDSNGIINLCANSQKTKLTTILVSNGMLADSAFVTYFGQGVQGDSIDPSSSFNGNGGQLFISMTYNDPNNPGCTGTDTVNVSINSIPTLSVGGWNSSLEYCGNDAPVNLTLIPDYLNTINTSINITGLGINLDTTNTPNRFIYNPSQVHPNSKDTIDLITFNFTDEKGCSNTSTESISIDSVPVVAITGLASNYCKNSPNTQIIRTSPPSGALVGSATLGPTEFQGIGIDQGTGIFSPDAGPNTNSVGMRIINYVFTDTRGCQGETSDTTEVYPLPALSFPTIIGPFCSSDPLDSLYSGNDTLTGYYSFTGSLIADSIGILDPSLDTGTNFIYYSYTDSNNCTNIDSADVTVHPTPEITITNFQSAYCGNDGLTEIFVSPAGGTLDPNSANGFTAFTNTSFRFNPQANPNGGYQTLIYNYTAPFTGCQNTFEDSTYVYTLNTPSFNGLLDFYCETTDTIELRGLPTGGNFSTLNLSSIIYDSISNSYGFVPANAGGGVHGIIYTVIDSFIYTVPNTGSMDTLVCAIDTVKNVNVRSLPTPMLTLLVPGNGSRFCSNKPAFQLKPVTFFGVEHNFSSITGGVIRLDTLVQVPGGLYDSIQVYYFSPDSAGSGQHRVIHVVTDTIYGCQDSTIYQYDIDEFIPAQILGLDTTSLVYCANADSFSITGIPFGNGVMTKDGDTLVPPYFFVPNPNTSNNPIFTTLTYAVEYNACSSSVSRGVQINPVQPIDFTDSLFTNFNYCLGEDSIQLYPNISGGYFEGRGIILGNSFLTPNFTGYSTIKYNYNDPTWGCSSSITKDIIIYGKPNLNFAVEGDCEDDNLIFRVDNNNLGLNTIENGILIDSLTNATWDFGDGNTIPAQWPIVNNAITIDTATYQYNNAGVYFATLRVNNRYYCADSQTVRVVISPNINSFPYVEDFENGPGDWFAESRDPNARQLWEWGADSNSLGIASGTNQFWATQLNTSYSVEEDAWVYSPCFDINALTRPMISLDKWSDSERKADGTVIEYRAADGTWKVLGQLNRGINWYDTDLIVGQPGNQGISPIGWSGQDLDWINSRYKLDSLDLPNGVLRLRFAFGASPLSLSNFYDGFAFDNVWIGNRTRNVLLETTSNINEPGMPTTNRHVYDLAFHSSVRRDVILLQYNGIDPDPNDEFFQKNKGVANSKTVDYSMGNAGEAAIDGRTAGIPSSDQLGAIDFEVNMLESPKFDIVIDSFTTNINEAKATVTFTALDNLPFDSYILNITVTQDSLKYNNGNGPEIHAVVRENNRNSPPLARAWNIGDQVQITYIWEHPESNLHTNFKVVAYIQNDATNEVYQAATDRDVSGYLTVNINNPTTKTQFTEVSSLKVFPNPAGDYFRVQFDKVLEYDYDWRLVDIRGVEVLNGTIEQGNDGLQISNYDLPPGMYIFVLNNDKVFAKRKLIIQQD